MSPPPVLLSVNVGLPRDVPWHGKTVYTGVYKEPVTGPRMVRRLNIDGDGQGDKAGHGGEQRAVMVYQLDSYHHWREHFGRDDLTYGIFGENLTVDGLADAEVCIGDRYRIGEAEFEVTQPRVTCYRVGLRFGAPELPALLVGHHRPGFYMRVITEGHIQAGDQIVKTRSGPGALSVADVDALLYLGDHDQAKLRAALAIPALSPGWQASFRDLLAVPGSDGLAPSPPPATRPAWPGFRKLRVTRISRESDHVVSLYLAAADGTGLPAFRAGQYLTLKVDGAGDPAPIRNYSLSSPADAGTYRISVKREPQGLASRYLDQDVKPGTVFDVAAPRGNFILDDGTGPVLLVSAGIGVTPVLSILHQLAAGDSQRDIWWLHGARGPREHPFAAEAHTLLAGLPHTHELIYYSAATAAEQSRAHASPGRLSRETLAGLGLPPAASAYICGPASFTDDMRDALTGIGLDQAAIHTELFGALSAINPGVVGAVAKRPHQPSGAPGTGPRVTFSRSGLTVPFGRTWSNVLDLADACDVPTRWSCRTGVCHTCVTPLLTGEISYDPDPLEPPAGGQILICCARPTSDIVLDL
jgi:ferredoxin-NADP reductase/MOSC domain-containing protein YiiM/ferredoxin